MGIQIFPALLSQRGEDRGKSIHVPLAPHSHLPIPFPPPFPIARGEERGVSQQVDPWTRGEERGSSQPAGHLNRRWGGDRMEGEG